MVKSTIDGSSVPSFLMKCYEMVEDQSTDRVISWSESNNSFVIWNMVDFTLHLLPKYFKHNNFASFMRQLNIYGFRKSDTDRWEFSNDAFIRGQQQLLKNILRRKNVQALNQRKSSQQKHDKSDGTGQEIENSGLWKEVESLKIDKNVLMQELLKLRQLQETSESKLQGLGERLQEMETDQQQMLSFLIMAIQSPGFLDQLLQPKENNWHKSEVGKNMLVEVSEGDEALSSDAMLIGYHHPSPSVDEVSNSAKPTEFDLDGLKDLYINADFMKIFMDENRENHSPFRSDLSDNSVLQQLLLGHHLLDKTLDYKFDTEEPNDESMDMESTIDSPEMEKSLSF